MPDEPERPRPGMPQSEKDRLGRELAERAAKANRPQRDTSAWFPDAGLDQLTKDVLLAEAALRGVTVPKSATKPDLIKRLRAASNTTTSDDTESDDTTSDTTESD